MYSLAPLVLLAACGPGSILTGRTDDTAAPADTDPDDTEHLAGLDDTGEDTDTTDPGDDEDDLLYAAFFDPSVIQTVDIVLTDAAIRQLNIGASDAYVHGDATINGVYYSDIGVRLKGSSTYQDLDCSDGYCKAAFKLRLDEFVDGQKYGSLQRVTLNNMTSDYTQSKEVIVYDLLNQQSQLASRCNYARVTLNGQDWGLYANVETADDEWLKRRFSDPDGEFWGTGANYGDFYESYLDSGWVTKSGTGDKAGLLALTHALDGFSGDFFGELDPYINTSQWLDYWAWCVALGNYDGYPFHINDVLIYGDPSDGTRYVFAPWGTDETWDEYEYTGQTWNTVGARLGYACLYDQACVTELKARISDAVDAYDATDVLGIAEAAWALSEADVQTDPKRPFTPDYVWYYRDYYQGVMPHYGDYVRGKVGL